MSSTLIGIDETAPVITRGSIVIEAPLPTVWAVHTDIASWPEWHPGVGSTTLLTRGELCAGSSFRWVAEGLDVTSHVYAALLMPRRSQYSVLSTQYSVLSTQSSVLSCPIAHAECQY